MANLGLRWIHGLNTLVCEDLGGLFDDSLGLGISVGDGDLGGGIRSSAVQVHSGTGAWGVVISPH